MSALLSALVLSASQAAAPIEFNFESRNGLSVNLDGVPVIRGSWFQYYAPGWTKGYYSSRWNEQQVKRIDADTIEATYALGANIAGSVMIKRAGSRLTVRYQLGWNSDEKALVEITPGMLWLTPWRYGTISADGTVLGIGSRVPKGNDMAQRKLGNDARVIRFEGPLGQIVVNSGTPLTAFDARGYGQDWAEGRPLIWQGASAIPLEKGKPTTFEVQYDFSSALPKESISAERSLETMPLPSALNPSDEITPLIPAPKTNRLDWTRPLEITGGWNFPAGRFRFFDLFRSELARRFVMPVLDGQKPRIAIDGGVSRMQLKPGSYRLKITDKSISLFGEEEEGLQNAAYRLAQLAFTKNGKLYVPTGYLEDVPVSDFRGVHLFVGKSANDFQKKLWDRVLRPLGLNKVVLQCERTEWNSLPGIEGPITMKQSDLVKLFGAYRAMNVEPIPLIQSFGHMEWFFGNGKNLELAINPKVPYAIDPREQGARDKLKALWKEAVAVLKPSTIHVGLDEVDMRGFEDRSPGFVTELWRMHLPFLGEIAKENGVKLMLWGDKGLAPGEAVDAAHGNDRAQAQLRRDAIPKGALIADWHYKADPNPQPFLKSLQVWKRDGFKPIASTWYRPENVRGFFLAAALEGAGMLQTTWAGYESNEENMLRALKQFSAMVLAADYSWSARQDELPQLGYDPMTVFAEMYNRRPLPLTPTSGTTSRSLDVLAVGPYRFGMMEAVALRSVTEKGVKAPTSFELSTNIRGKLLVLAADCQAPADEAEVIGEVELHLQNGTKKSLPIRYGLHVRAQDDSGVTFYGPRQNGISAIPIDLDPKQPVRKIVLRTQSAYAGLTLRGVTVL